ncbi:hypothetical protein [Desulfococcus sp.]|uniref:hypothetical protein n=1 Tax=Desulfococcus sp. TaxID=2025834 RepID=UPI003593966F
MVFGCAYPQHQTIFEPGLPEKIHAAPPAGYSETPLVCVLGFASPDTAPGMGGFAAVLLHRELLIKGIPSEIRPDVFPGGGCSDAVRSDLCDNCGQVITGEIRYYFEGSELMPSRVDQEIRVTDLREPIPRVLWEAAATEVSDPIAADDWIILQTSGAAALPAAELMRRNAEKFANMISAAGTRP